MATIVTADVFEEFCKTGNRKLLSGNFDDEYTVPTPVTLEEITFPDSFPTIRNFNFDGGIEFIGCRFSGGIKILNCIGRNGIKFNNCSSSGFNNSDPKPAIEIQNFTFDHLSFTNCNLPNGLYLLKGTERQDLNILSSLSFNNCSFSQAGLTIESTRIKTSLSALNITGSEKIHFYNIEVNQGCLLKNITSDEILFSGENLKISVGIEFLKIKAIDLKFTNGVIDGDISIKKPNISNILSFNNLEITGKTILDVKDWSSKIPGENDNFPISIPSILINASNFNLGLYVNGDSNLVKKIGIDFSPKLKGRLVFTSINIELLKLRGTNIENNLVFRNIGFKEIDLKDFLNLKTLLFSNLNAEYTKQQKAVFKIIESDLGSWELSNFDFSAFKTINWQDSQIFGLRSSSVNWFKDESLKISGDNIKITCFRRREFYKQLKLSCEKQGDRISELEFKRREIKAYKKGLKISKEKRIDRFTIWTGGSNNHGLNWIKPVGLILLFTTFLFYPLIFMAADPDISLWCLKCEFISFNSFGNKFWHYGSIWPSLFNPARRVSDLFPGVNISFALGFWDGLQRIVLAFFIFQIISAFRKFVK